MADTVLVTGADGFIGSHLVEALLLAGRKVRAFVYYHPISDRGWLTELPRSLTSGLEVFPGDVRDHQRVDAAMKGVGSVFHLAALIGIPYSYHAPASYLQTNVLGTQHVLDAALRHGVGKVLVTSTSEVYGTARYVPIDEAHPRQAQSPYSASKIAADALAQSYHLSFGLPVVTVRPFNTYGPRQSLRAIIPSVILQLLGGAKVLSLGDLTPTRDLLFVKDTVQGFMSIEERAEIASGGEYNLATERETSMAELVNLIQTLLGTRVPVVCDEARLRPAASEVMRLCGCARRSADLGWSPRVDLAAGLEETIAWTRKKALHLDEGGGYRL
jgi:NAD dependent epimerase/dehydratase